MKLLTIVLLILSVYGCSESNSGPDEDAVKKIENVSFYPIGNFGSSLLLQAKVEKSYEFKDIRFYLGNKCENSSVISSATKLEVLNGVNITLPQANNEYAIYYKTFGGEKSVSECNLWTNYTHDSIAPSSPNSSPTDLVALNSIKTRERVHFLNISDNYYLDDSRYLNVYADASKTLLLGELDRFDSAIYQIELLENQTNNLYLAFRDEAGNESSSYNTGISIVHDSISPNLPTITTLNNQFVSGDTLTINGSCSGDSETVRVYSETLLDTPQDIDLATFSSGLSINLNLNQENTFFVTCQDGAGNESNAFEFTVTHDNIAPITPFLSTAEATRTSSAIQGPTNKVFIESESGTQISVYDDVGLSSVITSGTSEEFKDGVDITFPLSDSVNSLYFISTDKAGNTSATLQVDYTVDSTPPSLISLDSGVSSKEGSLDNANQVEILFQSLESDIVEVRIVSSLQDYKISRTQAFAGHMYTYDTNQINSIQFFGIDHVGLVSTPISLNITHDNIGPDLNPLSPLDNGTIRDGGVISGSCENLDVSISGDVNSTVTCVAGVFSYTLGNYSHGDVLNLIISEYDLAGNLGQENLTLTVDNIAPVVTIDAHPSDTNDSSLSISGTCEGDYPVFIEGDNALATNCIAGLGLWSVELNAPTEGLYNFTAYQLDPAGNRGEVNFSINFDYTPPAPISLDESVTDIHASAIEENSFALIGNAQENFDIDIFSDLSKNNKLMTITASQLSSGVVVNLAPDRINDFVFTQTDSAGNTTQDLVHLSIYQKENISKYYDTSFSDIYTNDSIARGVSYKYLVKINNETRDTDVSIRVVMEAFSVSSPIGDIVIDPASNCLTEELKANGSCDLILNINYSSVGIKDNNLTLTYFDGRTETLRVRHKVVDFSPITTAGSGPGQNTFSLWWANTINRFANNMQFYDVLSSGGSNRRFTSHSLFQDDATSADNRLGQCSSSRFVYGNCPSSSTLTNTLCVYNLYTTNIVEFNTTQPMTGLGGLKCVEYGDYDILINQDYDEVHIINARQAQCQLDPNESGCGSVFERSISSAQGIVTVEDKIVYEQGGDLLVEDIATGVIDYRSASPIARIHTVRNGVGDNILISYSPNNNENIVASYNKSTKSLTNIFQGFNSPYYPGPDLYLQDSSYFWPDVGNYSAFEEYEVHDKSIMAFVEEHQDNEVVSEQLHYRIYATDGSLSGSEYLFEVRRSNSGSVERIVRSVRKITNNLLSALVSDQDVVQYNFLEKTWKRYTHSSKIVSFTTIEGKHYIIDENGSLQIVNEDFTSTVELLNYGNSDSVFIEEVANFLFIFNMTSKQISYYDFDFDSELFYYNFSSNCSNSTFYSGILNGYLNISCASSYYSGNYSDMKYYTKTPYFNGELIRIPLLPKR